MDFREFLKTNNVYLDGGMGTVLQGYGLKGGEFPEVWNITHPDIITKIHREYFEAGSNVVCANTFGANGLKFTDDELERIISSAVANANKARAKSRGEQPKFVALDMGPLGRLLKPLGDFDFEEAVSLFAKTVKLGVKYGVDLVIIETMNDSYETKAALLAVKENSSLPVLVSNAYGADGKLMMGSSPAAMVAMLEGLGADGIGANCSLGPAQLTPVIRELLSCASVPVILKPNAGLPRIENGETVFDITPEEFADAVTNLMAAGVRIAGGCCGTGPRHIELLTSKSRSIVPRLIKKKTATVVSSYADAVEFGKSPLLIGERINPTGKKRFKQALVEKDMGYILNEGVNQEAKGVHILDVNVGLPDIDEAKILCDAVYELQNVVRIPLQIDTADATAMERALRIYNGKAMINSVTGKAESMSAIFPLVKKYGGVVVALTLDEDGIPSTAEGRVEIARRILDTAQGYGIDKKDIVFDTLAMTVSADTSSPSVTLKALKMIREELGCHTLLGVSNVSFGLPSRDAVNGTFFTLAMDSGLSAAIMNPYSAAMMQSYYAFKALRNMDDNCMDYIANAESFATVSAASATAVKPNTEYKSDLQYAVVKGFKEETHRITEELLSTVDPLGVVQNEIIPALNIVGKGFEEGRVYLPELLMSAEAAKTAFEVIRTYMSGNTSAARYDGTIVIATVEGDIHDIGKNIVKLLLENYGFNVIDLGKDVPPRAIVNKIVETSAKIAVLSALMTTTVPAMEETVRLIKETNPDCRTVVGGAVLTQGYADVMGADKYCKDAMEVVRYAEELLPDNL